MKIKAHHQQEIPISILIFNRIKVVTLLFQFVASFDEFLK
jgi:hypothetical protein